MLNSNTTDPNQQLKAGRWSRLDTAQKILVMVAASFAGLLLTVAIYQVFYEEQTPVTPSPAASKSVPSTADVTITEQGFSPSTISLRPNTQLTWTNNDSEPHQIAANPHPLHNSIEGFDSNIVLQKDETLSFTFVTSGTYTLHDHLDPLNPKFQMTVIVE